MAELQAEVVLGTLQTIEPRAERADSAEVVQTYVENAQLQSALLSTNNQVIFGRRGTGKTHALRYLAERVRSGGDLAAYISMDRLGSTQGLYSDTSLTAAQRGVRLLVDVVNEILSHLLEWSVEEGNQKAYDLCDRLAIEVNELRVEGQVQVVEEGQATAETTTTAGFKAALSKTPTVSAEFGEATKAIRGASYSLSRAGLPIYNVHVGAVSTFIKDILDALVVKRAWLFLDEWSELPPDLQPILADMLRKTFFTVANVTVKIAAIPHRSFFYVSNESGRRMGLDVGGDIFGAVDLDQFVVFPAATKKGRDDTATDFFRSLLFKHVQHALQEAGHPQLASEAQFASIAFTQVTALTEVARAAEGVPRDGIGVAARAALRAQGRISTENVREAAYLLFQNQKLSRLNGAPMAGQLLDKVVDQVIGSKKARAFLLRQDHTEHPVISFLIDERLLHLIKRGYSAQDRPGERYDILQIDYGCYVSLLSTSRAPDTLLGFAVDEDLSEDEQHRAVFSTLAVPEHDNRAVRRAIVDLPDLLGDEF